MAHARATIGATNYAVAITAGHHQLNADEGPALGGKDTGPAPFEILCSALAACTAITLRRYAERKAWPLRGMSVDVRFSGTGKEVAIARVLSFEGELSREQRARLADIAERTPVTLALKNGVAITTTVA
ncbi:MAG: OsmC family protein [Xanthobacteraceae bacterium]